MWWGGEPPGLLKRVRGLWYWRMGRRRPACSAGVLGFPLGSLESMMDFRRPLHQQEHPAGDHDEVATGDVVAEYGEKGHRQAHEVLILEWDERRAVRWPQSWKLPQQGART